MKKLRNSKKAWEMVKDKLDLIYEEGISMLQKGLPSNKFDIKRLAAFEKLARWRVANNNWVTFEKSGYPFKKEIRYSGRRSNAK